MISRRATLTCWAVFLAVCGIAGALKLRQNAEFREGEADRYAESKEAIERFRRERPVALKEMRDLLEKPSNGDPANAWTVAELNDTLPGGTPLKLVDVPGEPGRKEARWAHPGSGIVFTLRFDADDRLRGWGHKGGPRAPQTPPPSRATFVDAGEQFRGVIVRYGTWLWVALTGSWFFARGYRPIVAQLALATGIASGVAHTVQPAWALSDMFSNDPVFIDAAMAAISCAMLAAPSPTARSFVARWLLPRRFSLLWMMGVTAVIAVLVTLGFAGYAISGVIAVGAIAFLVLASGMRRPPRVDADSPRGRGG